MIQTQNKIEELKKKKIIDYQNKNENQTFEQTEMIDFLTGTWILRFYFKNGNSFQLQAELLKGLKEKCEVKNQILKIMVLISINKINQQCLDGQFYLNMGNGQIGYKLNLFVQPQYDLRMMFLKLIEHSKNIMIKDFSRHVLQILEKLKIHSQNTSVELSNQNSINQNIENVNQYNILNTFGQFFQVNQIEIYEKENINNNYLYLTFLMKHLDGNLIKLRLYKKQFQEVEITNLKKIGFLLQLYNNNSSTRAFNQYLQVYFYQENDFYCLKNQYYSLEKFLSEQSFKLSFYTKLIILLSIAKGIQLIHQTGIIHSYINLSSIYIIPNNRQNPIIGHLEKAYCEMTQDIYEYQNQVEYTPSELKNRKLKYPNIKTDIYQFAILMLQVLFQIQKYELKSLNLELFKQRIFSSGHIEIMSQIYNLLITCIVYVNMYIGLEDSYFLRPTIERVIYKLKRIIYITEILYQTYNFQETALGLN